MFTDDLTKHDSVMAHESVGHDICKHILDVDMLLSSVLRPSTLAQLCENAWQNTLRCRALFWLPTPCKISSSCWPTAALASSPSHGTPTMNKSQGRTMCQAGLYLPAFFHISNLCCAFQSRQSRSHKDHRSMFVLGTVMGVLVVCTPIVSAQYQEV